MSSKNYLLERVTAMNCFGCFGFTNKPSRVLRPNPNSHFSLERLLDQSGAVDDEEEEEGEEEGEGADDVSNYGEVTLTGAGREDDSELQINNAKRSEEIIRSRIQNGLICREVPVKETVKVVRSEDENGNKMINEYVREYKIGSGSYGKVVLYRSSVDGRHYAIKAFHKSRLKKTPVGLSETAMTDVLREVLIMKVLKHPNIVNLVEVIDDPCEDHFYMVLEYVESKLVFKGFGSPGGLEENTARKYLRDIVSGLMYLHAHHIVHGDIKPDNLLVTSSGHVKIGDFSVSQVFEDENDELRRSPGTIVFTAPECCLGLTYHGKTADIWAVGVTLYYMVLGQYPFIGDGWQDTYDKIVNNPLLLPDDLNPLLKFLIEGLLCKDPRQRLTLEAVAEHAWVMGDNGPIPLYLCWCKRNSWQTEQPSYSIIAQDTTQDTEAQTERRSHGGTQDT